MYKNLIYEKGDISNQRGKDGIVNEQLVQLGSYLKQKAGFTCHTLHRINSK